MKVRLLKRLRKKSKSNAWIEYSDGLYRVNKKLSDNFISNKYESPILEKSIKYLAKCRRDMILSYVTKMREKVINKEIRNL